MILFKETVALKSNNKKEEVIALLDKNIEHYHKDNSKLIFEGRINPEGIFNIRLKDVNNGGRVQVSTTAISGNVQELEDGKSLVEIEFAVAKTFIYVMGFLSLIMILLSVVLYAGVLNLKSIQIPWYIPLAGLVLNFLSIYISPRLDRRKTVTKFKEILS